MATSLSTLTSLEDLHLGFISPQYQPGLESRGPFSPICSVFPTLAIFCFLGAIKYLEEFVARIDTPRLSRLSTKFLNDKGFDIPELNQFVCRTPTLGAYDEAYFNIFMGEGVRVRLYQSHPEPSDARSLEIGAYRDLSTVVARICTPLLHLLPTIENLCIDGGLFSTPLDVDDNFKWLDFLLPFKAVKNLYISDSFSARIALVLEELTGERTTEVLPALQNVLVRGLRPLEHLKEGVAQFISARQLANRPVAISVWR